MPNKKPKPKNILPKQVYRNAIYVWRKLLLRHGITLPLLASLELWYKGKDYQSIPLAMKEGKRILADLRRNPITDYTVNGVSERQKMTRFVCVRISALVFGYHHGIKTFPPNLFHMYEWTGLSRTEVNGKYGWGEVTKKDLEFFEMVKEFICHKY